MDSVLIVGGNGYVGSKLAADTGWPVLDLPDRYEDIREMPETAVFLAGHTDVASCNAAPLDSYKNNVKNFSTFAARTKRMVFASTMLVYGDGAHTETSECVPTSTYARQKLEAERLCHGRHVILRFGVVCGRSPKQKWSTLINKMIDDAKKTGVVRVSGTEFWRPVLGTNDASRALQAAVAGYQPGTYNVHSFDMRISDIGSYVAKKLGVDLVVEESMSNGIRMSNAKFKYSHNFEFKDTLESIVEELR